MQPGEQEPGLDEVRALIAELPGPDLAATTGAIEALRRLGLAPRATGRLGDLGEWLAGWQGRAVPRLTRPRVAVFAACHGIAAADGPAIAAFVQASVENQAAINRLCAAMDADLRVYDLAIETPTRDFTAEAAMDEAECARAAAYGMMAVEHGIDLLVLGGHAAGERASVAALAAALLGHDPAGLADADAGTVAAAVARYKAEAGDPFEALRCLGGFETAALVGAILAARLARTPVLLDGVGVLGAAVVLHAAYPRALDHCRLAELPAEPAAAALAEALGLAAASALDAGTLGTGAAGAAALGSLRAAAGLFAPV